MVIIATKKGDGASNDVIDWIIKRGEKVVRVDEDNQVEQIHISSEDTFQESSIQINGQKIYLKNILALWHRKGEGFHTKHAMEPFTLGNSDFDISAKLSQEWQIVREYLYFLLAEKRTLGNYFSHSLNKFIIHRKAKAIGFKIPQSMILTSKEEALKIELSLITKPISEVAIVYMEGATYGSYTTELTKDFIQTLSPDFFPALMQQKLEKQYEVRTFYLDGECYSMAMFSQMSKKTQVDFRVYNHARPNRSVVYKLPQVLEDKIRTLMQSLDLNTGSLDFIVTPDQQYYFLEINPLGQFGMVSEPCNYYLEKKIADFLVNSKKQPNA